MPLGARSTLIGLLGLAVHTTAVGCNEDPQVEIRICGDIVIPPAGQELVTLPDGAVVEVANPTADGGMARPGDASDAEDETPPVDALRITTRREDYEPIERSVLELSSGSDRTAKGIDRSITFPRSQQMRWITVEGLRGGVVSYEFARRVAGDTEAADILLSQACFGIRCAFGLTCIAGTCELAPEPGDGPHCGDDE